MAFHYDNVKPWGRSYKEYLQMFDLSPDDLKLNILGIGDGPASFNATMASNGIKVISVDPIYQLSKNQIRDRINESFDDILAQTAKNTDKFRWTTISNLKELGEIRMSAMDIFLNDYDRGKIEGRYIFGSLPSLDFKNSAFDIIISSHLLFLYSNLLDLDFHIASISEMLRIAKEVRIFPILDANGEKSKHVIPLQTYLLNQGFNINFQKVNYEFQINGNECLIISKK